MTTGTLEREDDRRAHTARRANIENAEKAAPHEDFLEVAIFMGGPHLVERGTRPKPVLSARRVSIVPASFLSGNAAYYGTLQRECTAWDQPATDQAWRLVLVAPHAKVPAAQKAQPQDTAEDFRSDIVREIGRYRSEDAAPEVFERIAVDVDKALRAILPFVRLPEAEINEEGSFCLYWVSTEGGERARAALTFGGSGHTVASLVYSSERPGTVDRISLSDQQTLARKLSRDDFLRIVGPKADER